MAVGLEREVLVTRWLERVATAMAFVAANLTGVSPAPPPPRRRAASPRAIDELDARRRRVLPPEAVADTF